MKALENRKRKWIDVDTVSAFGLGRRQHGTVRAFNPSPVKRDPGSFEIDAAPAQTEKLRATRPGDRGEPEHLQERVAVSNEVQQ